MNLLMTLAVSFVMLLHIYFMVLEMFFWNKPLGRKTFGLTKHFAKESEILAANQGLYNGFLAAGLLWGLIGSGGFDALIFFLGCIIIAGAYGSLTVRFSILWIQALPAAVAMALVLLNY